VLAHAAANPTCPNPIVSVTLLRETALTAMHLGDGFAPYDENTVSQTATSFQGQRPEQANRLLG